MITWHYRDFLCGGLSWDAIARLQWDQWLAPEAFRWRGRQYAPGRVYGKLLHRHLQEITTVNPESWEPEKRSVEVNEVFDFRLIRSRGLVGVQGRKGDVGVLAAALDAAKIWVELVPIELDLVGILETLRSSYQLHDVKAVRIEDFLAHKDELLTSASFKLLEREFTDRVIQKYSDQLGAFTLAVKLADGACSVKVTRDGTVSLGDDQPELHSLLENCVQNQRQPVAAHVETVVIQDPENPRGMTGRENLQQAAALLKHKPMKGLQ